MIFLTVGSALPFDRLVKLVDQAILLGSVSEPVFAQIGAGGYTPRAMNYRRFLSAKEYKSKICEASSIVSHAGIGTISAGLGLNKPMLVMPRRREYDEIVDDHQLKTARIFSEAGHLMWFESAEDFVDRVNRLHGFAPKVRQPNREGLAGDICRYLQDLVERKKTNELNHMK